ncbi:MAG: type I-E CRISPR-associated protein Cse1/CasA [Legionellales bacterium]
MRTYKINLITDRWLPVLYTNGQTTFIAPYELTIQDNEASITSLNTTRADFNGALIQFLIGLLQTAKPELTGKQWRQWYKTPPSSDELKDWFSSLIPYFNLYGDGPCFMQDLDPLTDSPIKSISALLIEQPGEQTLKNNVDHFIKRDQVKQLCPACAATALFTLQTNAPSGGQGHRTSMRGGGPLTSIVVHDGTTKSFWDMLWLNVLSKTDFEKTTHQSLGQFNYERIFPWFMPTLTSEEDQEQLPSAAHLFQMYWGMPRRIRLKVSDNNQNPCDLCATVTEKAVTEYITKNYGIKYSEDWRHVLSPYRVTKDNQAFPLHPQPGGIGYQHWITIALENSQDSKTAAVIRANRERIQLQQQEEGGEGDPLIIWSFGYDMDNMSARCWYEYQMPWYNIVDEQYETVTCFIKQFIKTTEQARYYLIQALNDCGVPTNIARHSIWQKTETKFYESLGDIIKHSNNEYEIEEIKTSWLEHIHMITLNMFDIFVNVNHIETNCIKTYVQAKQQLKRNLYGKKIYEILGLTKEKKVANE